MGGAPGETLVCSSAGGGLRLAVVGYEEEVTAHAGHRVGLSAGARVVHVAAGPMSGADVADLRAARPDVVLLVGGTDGGNADVLLHNAGRLARGRVTAPVVVAGNEQAAAAAGDALAATGRRHVVTDNVLPRIGVIAPAGARAAIRAVFLEHVIGGKGLSRGPEFARLVRAATPDAVLTGVEVLAAAAGGDVLVVDVGGATSDVYSVITPQGEDASLHREVVAPLWHARTVEADLGMRWNAEGVLAAAGREGLEVGESVRAWAGVVGDDPGRVPRGEEEAGAESELARLAVLLAARRHGRPDGHSAAPRPLADVALLVGSGGALRHGDPRRRELVLGGLTADHGGGWRVPRAPRPVVDTHAVLFAVGLLAADHPAAARGLVARLLAPAPD